MQKWLQGERMGKQVRQSGSLQFEPRQPVLAGAFAWLRYVTGSFEVAGKQEKAVLLTHPMQIWQQQLLKQEPFKLPRRGKVYQKLVKE